MEFTMLGLDEMDQASLIHRAAFDERMPWLAGLHTPDEDKRYFRDRVFPACTIWGARNGEALVGFVAFRPGWVDQLYVLPSAQRCGVGTALLDLAKSASATLSLWTFQRNRPAREFYERHGFVMIDETDGSGNEELEPDVLYRWTRE